MAIIEHLPFGQTAQVLGRSYLQQENRRFGLEIEGDGLPPLPFTSREIDYYRSRVAEGAKDKDSDRSETVITYDHRNDALRYVGFGLSLPLDTTNPKWILPNAWGCLFQVLQRGNPNQAPYSPSVSINFGTVDGHKCLSLIGRGNGGYKALHHQPLDIPGKEWMFNKVFNVLVGFNLKAGQAIVTYQRPWDGFAVTSGWVDHELLLTGPQTDGHETSIVKFGLYTASQAFGGEYWANFVNVKYTNWYGEAKNW